MVYFSFGFEAINNQADRTDVMSQTLAWLGECCDGVYDAGFTWAPSSPLVGEEIVFTGVASGTAPIEFDWDFGDGTMGHGVVVTHTYATSDTYTVVLTATNGCGAGVVDHEVIVLQPPIRYYIYLPIVVRVP